MSNYIKTTDFAVKDTYSSGDPRKVAKGSEVDTEFNNIATAITTKEDASNKGIANGYAPLDGNALVTKTFQWTTTAYTDVANVFTQSQQVHVPTQVYLELGVTDAATDAKYSRVYATSSVIRLESLNDAKSVNKSILEAARNANAITSITFGNSTDNPTYSFAGTGGITAAAFTGSGAALTGLNASSISSGSIGASFVPSAAVTQYQGSMKCRNLPSKGGTNVTLQAGGSPSGGSDGDIFYIY